MTNNEQKTTSQRLEEMTQRTEEVAESLMGKVVTMHRVIDNWTRLFNHTSHCQYDGIEGRYNAESYKTDAENRIKILGTYDSKNLDSPLIVCSSSHENEDFYKICDRKMTHEEFSDLLNRAEKYFMGYKEEKHNLAKKLIAEHKATPYASPGGQND